MNNTVTRITDATAVGGVSLWWYDWLSNLSTIAGETLPILGAIWLLVQIYGKVRSWF